MLALAAVLLVIMPERRLRRDRSAASSAFGQARATAQEGLRLALNRPVVKLIIAISFITGLAAEAWDRLYIPSAINRFDFPSLFGADSPVTWFAISGVIGTLLGLAAAELFKRRRSAALSAGSPARLLAGCAALQSAAIVVFTLSGSLWLAFSMLWLRTMVDAVSRPVQLAWLNRNLDPATRATVISMTGQANSIGQVAGGPALGWVGHAYSIRAALLGSALVLTPTIALYHRLITREHRAATPAAIPAALTRSRAEGQDTP
jgi:DHA3 family tetracycline resistance protein-like MFS transporter